MIQDALSIEELAKRAFKGSFPNNEALANAVAKAIRAAIKEYDRQQDQNARPSR